MKNTPSYQQVLDFWFKELTPEDWFVSNPKLDQQIKTKFSNIHTQAIQCELYHWRSSKLGRLAEIIVLDQFSRNIYRDKPESFAHDSLSLALAQEAIDLKIDTDFTPNQKLFLYLPFMHSESAKIHKIAVELFSQKGLEENLEYELKHKAIIDKFRRYPHRNEILNRKSTKEEIEFLKTPNSSF